MKAKEDLQLLQLADSRTKSYALEEAVSYDGVLSRYNIKEEKLDDLIKTVDIE